MCSSRALPALCLLLLPAFASAADKVDYLRDVKPLFARRCVECHGADKQRSGLRLDTAAAALKGGKSGPAVIPGKSASSRVIHAVTGAEGLKLMPPTEPRLTEKEVALLKAWIDDGAKAPANEIAAVGGTSKHWAFQPVVRPALPEVKNPAWIRNPIDRFVLARLEKEGIKPAPEADRVTLIRRLSLDLLGLPPTPEEVERFVLDNRPDAYERLVDRLLASPHYGERWGRHWLDAARYADSNGFNIDAPRSIWKYRDWVIEAINRDMPFDEFVIEQIAGDMLPNATLEQKVATGFHRNTLINQEGGIDVEQFRVESVVDRVNTTGAVFLGLTVGCAQCHDHKFDPLTQKEYYQLFAFLNNADEPNLDVGNPETLAAREKIRKQIADLEEQLTALDGTTDATVLAWEKGLSDADKAALPKDVQAALELPDNARSKKQIQLLRSQYRRIDEMRHAIGGLGHPSPFLTAAHATAAVARRDIEKRITALKKTEPNIVTTMVMQERKTPRQSYVHLGGDFLRKGPPVLPGVPASLHPLPQGKTLANRLDLARWIADPKNPLTPRVTVNRFWQAYFGTGIVETENDFGTQGTPPSHPELLDWLASELISQKWSMKAMHKLIVCSATYRQSSNTRPELATLDPRNRLLARQSRLRLEAEIVRDVSLSASGLLSHKIGGPSVFPPQPDGVYRFTQVPRDWRVSPGEDKYRRGMYTHFWRSAPYPELMVFDAPDTTTTCTRRNRSNTPLQALTLMNDAAFYEFAQGLASRVLKEAKPNNTDRIRYAFALCLARAPSRTEQKRLGQVLDDFVPTAEEAKMKPPAGLPKSVDANEYAAWVTVSRVLLNLDEFITRE